MSDDAKEIETRTEEKVAVWRKSHENTTALKDEILGLIHSKTFNSAVLMRLLAEVLLAGSNSVEAAAAFDTYVENQKLQLLKARSGARAAPDSAKGTQHIFELMLTALEGEAMFGYSRIEKIGTQLRDVLEQAAEQTPEDKVLFAGILARVAFWQMLVSVDDVTNSEHSDTALAQFKLSDQSEVVNVETVYAKGQYLALTAGPIEAFEPLKKALTESPEHIRLALLFIQVLSAEDKTEQALKITEMYLQKDLVPQSLLDKVALIELKKAHIALLELVQGPEAALAQLPEFVEMVGFLFGPSSPSEATNGGSSKTPANGAASRPRGGLFRRRATLESIASSTSTPTRDLTLKEESDHERRIVGATWLWIAQQYARAGLVDEARESVAEASKFQSFDHELYYTASKSTILGQLEEATNPKAALKLFLQALDADPLHLSSAVGIAVLLSQGSPSKADDRELARSTLSVLETACARFPGRYVPEAWYARGLLYEYLDGHSDAKDMYWKTVELEERRGVSRYVFVDVSPRH